MMTAIEYVDLIDEHLLDAIKNKYNRIDMRWGKYSSEMNREIRSMIENNDPESLKLKYVFVYWINISQLVDLWFKYGNKLYGKNKIKKKMREAREIKNVILHGVGADPLGFRYDWDNGWNNFVRAMAEKNLLGSLRKR